MPLETWIHTKVQYGNLGVLLKNATGAPGICNQRCRSSININISINNIDNIDIEIDIDINNNNGRRRRIHGLDAKLQSSRGALPRLFPVHSTAAGVERGHANCNAPHQPL